jgi:hypothetical protein
MFVLFEEEYVDDEYIDDENDPQGVEKITNNDYTLIEKEEIIGFDDVIETVRKKNVDITNYDKMMEKKIVESLKRGKIK